MDFKTISKTALPAYTWLWNTAITVDIQKGRGPLPRKYGPLGGRDSPRRILGKDPTLQDGTS